MHCTSEPFGHVHFRYPPTRTLVISVFLADELSNLLAFAYRVDCSGVSTGTSFSIVSVGTSAPIACSWHGGQDKSFDKFVNRFRMIL